MPNHFPQRRATQKPEIPDKLYFRIGEVARLCMVEPYVLRFWESEFSQLHPNKSGTGQRLYRKRDVEMALRIKRLLYDDGYTIAGARQVVQAEIRSDRSGQSELALEQRQSLERAAVQLNRTRRELRELLGLLASPAPKLLPSRKKTGRHRARRTVDASSSSHKSPAHAPKGARGNRRHFNHSPAGSFQTS